MAVDNAPARIGKTIVICGEVKGSEDLIVDGRVEGTVSLSESRLTIKGFGRDTQSRALGRHPGAFSSHGPEADAVRLLDS